MGRINPTPKIIHYTGEIYKYSDNYPLNIKKQSYFNIQKIGKNINSL